MNSGQVSCATCPAAACLNRHWSLLFRKAWCAFTARDSKLMQGNVTFSGEQHPKTLAIASCTDTPLKSHNNDGRSQSKNADLPMDLPMDRAAEPLQTIMSYVISNAERILSVMQHAC
jgi:hypothetical protein